MLFKDLSLGTSFFGVLLIVLPFRKALVSTVQMAPRYGPQIQWFLHSGYQNLAKKIVTFLKNFCWKNLKNLRIQHDLESKKFKFLNLQVKNKKKVGGYFLKKMHFCKNFTVLGLLRKVSLQGPKTFVLGDVMPRSKKKSKYRQKSFKFFFAKF